MSPYNEGGSQLEDGGQLDTQPGVDRRQFLKFAGLTGAAAIALRLGDDWVNNIDTEKISDPELKKGFDILLHNRGKINPLSMPDTSPEALRKLEPKELVRRAKKIGGMTFPEKPTHAPEVLASKDKVSFQSFENPSSQAVWMGITEQRFYKYPGKSNPFAQFVPDSVQPTERKINAAMLPIIRIVETQNPDGTAGTKPSAEYDGVAGWIYKEDNLVFGREEDPSTPDRNYRLPNPRWKIDIKPQYPEGYLASNDTIQLHLHYWLKENKASGMKEYLMPTTVDELMRSGTSASGMSADEAYKKAGKIIISPDNVISSNGMQPDTSKRHIEGTFITRQIIPLGYEDVVNELSGHIRDEKGRILYATLSCHPIDGEESTHRLVHWFTAEEVPAK